MRHILIVLGLFAVPASYSIGLHQGRVETAETVYRLKFALERYSDPEVLAEARKVSKITGRPLFTVLTGYELGAN